VPPLVPADGRRRQAVAMARARLRTLVRMIVTLGVMAAMALVEAAGRRWDV
jgi:hypothetical protein